MSENFQEILLKEIDHFFEPLLQAVESEEARARLFSSLGWDLESIPGFPIADLQNCLIELATTYTQVETWLVSPPATLEDLREALNTINQVVEVIQNLHRIMDLPVMTHPVRFEKFPDELIEFLLTNYLANRLPPLYTMLVLATIITLDGGPPSELVVDPVTNLIVRHPTPRPKLHFDRIAKLLQDPVALLKADYMPNGLTTYADAQMAAARLFPPLETLLGMIGIQAIHGINSAYGISLGPAGDEIAKLAMGIFVPLETDPTMAGSGFGAVLTFSPSDRGDLGLVILPFGRLAFAQTFEKWTVDLQLEGGVDGFAVHPRHGVHLPTQAQDIKIILRAILTKLSDEAGTAFLVGSAEGTRLQIGNFAIGGELKLVDGKQEYGILLEVGKAAFVVIPDDGDGFLQKILPQKGFNIDFDLAIGWSNKKGLYFRGSAGLEATVPVHIDLLGILKIDSIHLLLQTQNSDINIGAATTASLKFGPFVANVERMGLLAKLSFPPNGGNLGPANLELGFKPPDGAGMVIDSTAIVGGGYLHFDPKNEQYAGILRLEIKGGISLKAIGLLTTRLPDGSKGFSLLVIISAEFPPIVLGFGFTLNGVGGLLGVNRTMVLEALQAGVKTGTLNSIMFPHNPVENAQKIISDLQSVFPPVSGQFVFGPMLKLAWGKPATILTIDLGIVMEFPAPVRLAIMGQLIMALPSIEVEEKLRVAVLRMDVLGTIDFDTGDAAIDATIYNSNIGGFPISGEMAMRLNWGASPAFALAVGGFNPRFQPPPAFPALNRLAIALATGNNPRIRLEAYLALTSNTLQLGARLDIYAETRIEILNAVHTLSLAAYLAFDALVNFQPFSFLVDIDGQAVLKYNGNLLFSIFIHFSLSGPQPWHAVGQATFDFLGKRQIPVNIKIGEEPVQAAIPPGDPLKDLCAALQDSRNWSAQLPGDGHMLVTLRKIPVADEVLMHPLGELTVRQKAVPLDIAISKYGATVPIDRGPFEITEVLLNEKPTEGTRQVTRDLFAPGQFFEMTDDQKLSQPAFQHLPSGCTGIGTSSFFKSPKTVTATFDYDTVVIDNKDELSSRRGEGFEYKIANEVVLALAGLGAAAQSAMRATGSAKFAGPAKNRVQVEDSEFVVASKDTLQGGETKMSYIEAEAARLAMGAAGKNYHIVEKHEVA